MNKKSFLAHWLWGVFCLLGLANIEVVRGETDPKHYAVMMTAQVQSAPAQITLRWSADPNATGYTISRKPKDGGSWSTVGSVSGSTSSFTDSNVANGGVYEYRVVKSTSVGYIGRGYLLAGINAPLVDTRGKVILLVDTTHATELATELKRLEWDLAGDGWTVVRRDVARTLTPPQVKQIIKAAYDADRANTKAVFIFGNVAVPYSGNFVPDGHPDHQGAWVADTYYGDMDGTWTDSSVNTTGAHRPANRNVPGDGKFDQSQIPSNLELAVGRVDLSNMTCYSNKSWSRSERDLLRAYLNKDHQFRHRLFNVARRGLVSDNFGERGGEAFASSGWRNFGSFFGAENITQVYGGQFFSTLRSQDYLWAYGTGGGSYYTCNGIGSSDDFANNEIKAVFTMFLGSYFGDWDNESNFMRASLGSGYVLTTSWAGRPHWFYHHMGLGETIGYSTLASQNNGSGGLYENTINHSSRGVHVTLLGDPTLRMHPVVPPNNLRGTISGSTISLTWNPSTDTDLVGYHIYRGSGPTSPFSRVTSSPITSTSFTDNNYSAGNVYMVRAVKLERSGGGTYFNASQGVFFPLTTIDPGGGNGGSTPAAPTGLAATAISSSQINLTWTDNSTVETSYRIERLINGSWTLLTTVAGNTTFWSNTGLNPNTQYFYRVAAVNSAGTSPFSNQATATTFAVTQASATATFVRTDDSTQGNWKQVYGRDGYIIPTDVSAPPGYALTTPNGNLVYQWSTSTTDPRALQRPTVSGRIASCWYSPTSFTVDVNLIDGDTHRLALYFLDWDRSGRVQTVEVLDGATGAVIDTRTVSSFGEGKYLIWNVRGNVRFRFTRTSGLNAVSTAIFFDAPDTGASGNGSSTAQKINGKFSLRISGTAGQKYDIFASDNLVNWTRLTTVTLTSNTLDYTDPSAKTARFYRAVLVP